MAPQRTSFDKRERDRAKKAKQAAKRERRLDKDSEPAEGDEVVTAIPEGGELSAAQLLELIEAIHNDFDAGTISYEDFEERKAELLARLPID